ncbi:MAG: hypothetical protein NUW37_05140 [Planctomycetes bacterium]|nr:hypothetical protein [Planctomycetota bacterium]
MSENKSATEKNSTNKELSPLSPAISGYVLAVLVFGVFLTLSQIAGAMLPDFVTTPESPLASYQSYLNIANLRKALYDYADAHEGWFPEKLDDLVSEGLIEKSAITLFDDIGFGYSYQGGLRTSDPVDTVLVTESKGVIVVSDGNETTKVGRVMFIGGGPIQLRAPDMNDSAFFASTKAAMTTLDAVAPDNRELLRAISTPGAERAFQTAFLMARISDGIARGEILRSESESAELIDTFARVGKMSSASVSVRLEAVRALIRLEKADRTKPILRVLVTGLFEPGHLQNGAARLFSEQNHRFFALATLEALSDAHFVLEGVHDSFGIFLGGRELDSVYRLESRKSSVADALRWLGS